MADVRAVRLYRYYYESRHLIGAGVRRAHPITKPLLDTDKLFTHKDGLGWPPTTCLPLYSNLLLIKKQPKYNQSHRPPPERICCLAKTLVTLSFTGTLKMM